MFVRKGNRVKFLDARAGAEIVENYTEYEGTIMTKSKTDKWYWWIKDTKGVTHQVEKWQIISKIIDSTYPIYPAPPNPTKPHSRGSSVQKDTEIQKKQCKYCAEEDYIEKNNVWDISIEDERIIKIVCQSEYIEEYSMKIKYCPFCGRKIEEVANE